MIRELLAVWGVLLVAALTEAGGDACVRAGLRGAKWGFVAGPLALVLYGFLINVPRWEFGRLIGVYIAVFFLVSQAIAVLAFHERLHPPTVVGGALIVAGGLDRRRATS